MADKYQSFAELAKDEVEGRDYQVRVLRRPRALVVIAPHGGGIEPGTSEIAEAIAGDNLSFCAFEGIKLTGNSDLHITSTRFDEPKCLALVSSSPTAIAVHGEESQRQAVFLGGRDAAMLNRLRDSLVTSGFCVESHESSVMQGLDEANICNRTRIPKGVQIELSKGLRCRFFESLSRRGRQSKKERFYIFVNAVREAIE